ncbi:hypothetical protein L1987_46617 [Smallanthus sonchifolius]|uniref:Uncharacterized protein n=1 Tax=Smallanthus sonchifolius TaxID=185202 RepID=A0ACB9G090_9ASTR|nr:hypothetical protein L1987_46617 [Smallanthus sonchifolius]
MITRILGLNNSSDENGGSGKLVICNFASDSVFPLVPIQQVTVMDHPDFQVQVTVIAVMYTMECDYEEDEDDVDVKANYSLNHEIESSAPNNLESNLLLSDTFLLFDSFDCVGANYARENGIHAIIYPSIRGDPAEGLSSNDLVVALRSLTYNFGVFFGFLLFSVIQYIGNVCSKYKIDFILLAGYLKLISNTI